MERISQRFDLNWNTLDTFTDEDRAKYTVQARDALMKGLHAKGYQVLEGNRAYCGIPQSVIVTGQFDKPIKNDFYELAEELGLAFESGDFYMDHASVFAETDLSQAVADYKGRAQELEVMMKRVSARLVDVMRDEIIPAAEELLPEGYSLSRTKSAVLPYCHPAKGVCIGVPADLFIELVLEYDGKPIVSDSPGADGAEAASEAIMPRLEELAEKYNIHSIYPITARLQIH